MNNPPVIPKKLTLKGLQYFYKDKFLDVYGVYNHKENSWEFQVRGVSDTPKENHETLEEIAERFV